jgi:nitroreductase / dihydropteridine reductase
MEFIEIARNRYTTKKYDASKKITKEQIQQLKEIIRLSPSSINSQPWKVHFVSEEKTKLALAKASLFNEQKVIDASHLVVFSTFTDISLFEEQIRKNLPPGSVSYYEKFLQNLPAAELKAWFKHQVYLSLGFFLGACAQMGIDSTPMEGIVPAEYDSILQQQGHTALFAVAIGYRDETDANQPALKAKLRLPLETVVETI